MNTPRPYSDETPSGLINGLIVAVPVALLGFWVPVAAVGYAVFT